MPIFQQWLLFVGALGWLLSPVFVGIAFDETNLKGSLHAAACAVVCLSILPLLNVFI